MLALVSRCSSLLSQATRVQVCSGFLPVWIFVLQASREAAFTSFASLGFPDWVIIGSLEIFDGINGGVGAYAHDDFKDITGKEPTTIGQWVEGAVKAGLGVHDPAPAAPAAPAAPVVGTEAQPSTAEAPTASAAAAPATPTAVEVHANAPEAAPVTASA
jgi:hypothetical protein